MALSIKHPDADRLARELSRLTGESITEAVTKAIRERLVRESGWNPDGFEADVACIQDRLAKAPVLDDRTADEIIGYDEYGLPS